MSVALLPACGKRVTAFQNAVARLTLYLTKTVPPADAAAAARSVTASLRDMQRAFTKFALRIKQQDLAGFLAMGGPGGPIDTPIQAFVITVGALEAELPGKSLPLPG